MKSRMLVFRMIKFSDGTCLPWLNCTENNDYNQAIGQTLLEFIVQQRPEADAEFEELLQQAQQGTYKPEDPRFADYGINSNEIWLRAPEALPGHIAVTNEWTKYGFSEVSDEDIASGDYGPQQFTFDQYRQVLKFWHDCEKMVKVKIYLLLQTLDKRYLFLRQDKVFENIFYSLEFEVITIIPNP